jgi:flap endonuclease-1
MGIKLLSKLIADSAPEAIKEQEIANYFGRRIAIDASTCLYQFLVAIRMRSDLMVNGDGETTSHLIGFFHRTNKLLEVSQRLIPRIKSLKTPVGQLKLTLLPHC